MLIFAGIPFLSALLICLLLNGLFKIGQFASLITNYNEDAVVIRLESRQSPPDSFPSEKSSSSSDKANMENGSAVFIEKEFFWMEETPHLEHIIVAVFVSSTILLVVLPTAVYPTWSYYMSTACK